MKMSPATPVQVAAAFHLANSMKNGPFDPDGFGARVAELSLHLEAEPEDSRLRRVGQEWAPRGALYRDGQWEVGEVDLSRCSVWERMGGRGWAVGPASHVAELFTARRDQPDRVWGMVEAIGHVIGQLPLIVVRTKSDPSWFRIDDGSHRAVAAYLAGMRTAPAFVGTVPDRVNYQWRR